MATTVIEVSVDRGHYYQGRLGKRLWQRLQQAGIVRDLPRAAEDDEAFRQGLGFTDVVRVPSADSDLDVLVEFSRVPSFFEVVRLETDLSRLLGVRVDLVMKSALKPRIGEVILREAVPV